MDDAIALTLALTPSVLRHLEGNDPLSHHLIEKSLAGAMLVEIEVYDHETGQSRTLTMEDR